VIDRFVDLLARIDPGNPFAEVLGLPVLTRRPIHDTAGGRPYGLERYFLCELRKTAQEILQRHLLANHSVA